MIFSFFKKRNGAKTVLLVDIGSSSVGCALAKVSSDHSVHLVATTREGIPFQEELSSAKFLLAMEHALERALKGIQKKNRGGETPSSIFCTLSSPWFILKTRHIELAQEKEVVISQALVDDLLEEDLVLMKDELKGSLPDKDIAIIERRIIDLKLNGYEVKNPYGKKTTHMGMVAMVGLSSKKVVHAIELRISRIFHTSVLHFGTFPVALFSSLRDMYPAEKDFLFLDVTGEATDVSLVKDDLLIESASFPRGKNFFVREISAQLKTPHEAALTLFNMFFHNMLDTKKKVILDDVVGKGRTEWMRRFQKSTASLRKEGPLPQRVFVSVDTDVAPFFTELIKEAGKTGDNSVDFDVQCLDQEMLSQYITYESEIARDPFLIVEALLAGKINLQK